MFHRKSQLVYALVYITAACSLYAADVKQSSSEIYPLQSQLAVTGEARSVAAADLDNDGDIDLVVSNDFTSFISVLLNQGDGTFAPKVDYEVVASPWGMTISDLNGDSFADIAAANYYTYDPGLVSVLLSNGDGTFQGAVNYPTDNAPARVVAADFDGDSDVDLAVEGESAQNITILSNNGSGLFTLSGTLAGNYDIAAADFDGDDDIDLVTAVPQSDSVVLYLNQGDGSFVSSGSRACGNWLFSLRIADLDGDTYPDLVTVGANSNTISILKNDGTGDLQLQQVIPVGLSPWSVWADDIDHDGLVDLVVCNSNSSNIELVRQVSVDVFQSAGTVGVGSAPSAIVAVDIDNDSDFDVAVSNRHDQNISILYNALNFGYICGDVDGSLAPADIGDLTRLVSYMFKGGTAPYLFPAANIDGNLGIDVADLTAFVRFMFKGGAEPICQ